MSKKDTAKRLLEIASKRPKAAFKAVGYAGKYGLVGLRDRLHEEIVAESVMVTEDYSVPDSVEGNLLFSILVPVFNVDPKYLEKAIQSVKSQTYSNWELCLVDDCSTNKSLKSYLENLSDDRIEVVFSDVNEGISNASNKAAAVAHGDYFVLLDDDDLLAPNALEELFLKLSMTQADIIYSDNDVIDEHGVRLATFLKPDWSPDLFYSQMYIGHLLAFKASLFRQVQGFDSKFDGSQDYDLVLRMIELTDRIEHVQKVLYSWRSIPTSTATNAKAKPYAQTAGKNALQAHFDRVYKNGFVRVNETEDLFVYDVRYKLPSKDVLASIIIPTKDHADDLKKAIDSIINKTINVNYEIIILDNGSVEKSTKDLFSYLKNTYENIKIIDASYPFNWSKINNQGIAEASGEVIVCLNNDVEIISPDWLERLTENALREDIGVVGGLLLYPDQTIQHAGVVIGMGGFADHVYKACEPIHKGDPFISPMVNRNVSAVTGACMAFRHSILDNIGLFDENFIVCGSDVEFCLRAKSAGYDNLYLSKVVLTHFESKTRDPKRIPKIDFKLSKEAYRDYLIAGDPYYNQNLDYDYCEPTLITYRKRQRKLSSFRANVGISEIRPLRFRKDTVSPKRLNLLIPSINSEDIFGGISTALKLFNTLVAELNCDARILVLDGVPNNQTLIGRFSDYLYRQMDEEGYEGNAIVSVVNRNSEKSIPVSCNDIFLCTSWWSAYCIQEEYNRSLRLSNSIVKTPILYLIQDYEPGFYSWSSKYLLAESTYKVDLPKIAIFNSEELQDYFKLYKYSFIKEYSFNPFLNNQLKDYLQRQNGKMAKKRQILVYGRPHTNRNAFELIVESLRQWVENCEDSKYWKFISAGEDHPPVPLGKGRYLISVGKLPLEKYAEILSESFAGISLMVSPHPSYPPLEMASFGVQVITNSYQNKNLNSFSENIHSLEIPTPWNIAQQLDSIHKEYKFEVACANVNGNYIDGGEAFPFAKELADDVRNSWK